MEKKVRDIRKPEFMKEAITSRSHGAVLEIIIAFAVFFVGNMIISVVQTPAMMLHLFNNKEYIQMVQSGHIDFEKIVQMSLNLPDWFMIVVLLSEIGLIVVSVLYCRLLEKRKANTMGFRKKGCVRNYMTGVVIAVVAFLGAYLFCVVTGSVQFSATPSKDFSILYLVGFLLGYMVQGMAEEAICRGYLMVSLTKRYPVTASVIISSFFFSFLHGMNAGMSLLSYINLFLFGALMALLFIRYENIWLVAAFHGIWNFIQGNIFGVQISGLKLQRSLFTSKLAEDRSFINGGSFGMEGGIAVTLVLAAFIAFLLWRMSKKGYFVEAEPVDNPYDKMYYDKIMNQYNMYQNRMYNQNQNNPYSNVNPQNGNNAYPEAESNQNADNMQQNTAENQNPDGIQPSNPKDSEKILTGFDKSYFKD